MKHESKRLVRRPHHVLRIMFRGSVPEGTVFVNLLHANLARRHAVAALPQLRLSHYKPRAIVEI